MAKVSTYLNFPRNTEEAFLFYQSVFGGEFSGGGVARFKDIPPMDGAPPIAEEDKNLIMHIQLPILGGHLLMGTDAPESMGFKVNTGNNVYINLEPDTKEETKTLFDKLSNGGNITMDLQDTFWGAYYGSCIDKFGIQWMFNCPNANPPKDKVVVEVTVNTSLDKVWKLWNDPKDIIHWYFASEDWHTPKAENNLKVGESFNYRMEAKDGSMGFDFSGVYEVINLKEKIVYGLADGRKVEITFASNGSTTKVTETFDPESVNPIELQRNGWQAILNNFKKYAES